MGVGQDIDKFAKYQDKREQIAKKKKKGKVRKEKISGTNCEKQESSFKLAT